MGLTYTYFQLDIAYSKLMTWFTYNFKTKMGGNTPLSNSQSILCFYKEGDTEVLRSSSTGGDFVQIAPAVRRTNRSSTVITNSTTLVSIPNLSLSINMPVQPGPDNMPKYPTTLPCMATWFLAFYYLPRKNFRSYWLANSFLSTFVFHCLSTSHKGKQ